MIIFGGGNGAVVDKVEGEVAGGGSNDPRPLPRPP